MMFSWQRRIRKRLTLSILLAFECSAFSFWPFPPKRFTGNSLLEAGSLGLGEDQRILAFGDFNGDQFTDVVASSSDGRTVTVYLWDHGAFIFKRAASFNTQDEVQNVIPGDFTHDGTLDLLVMTSGSSVNSISMQLVVGSPGNGFAPTPLPVPASGAAQPIPLDANGDLRIDLLGNTISSSQLTLWKNVFNESNPNTSVFETTEAPFDGSCRVSNPHSNAVVDLDGDCLADVYLVCDGPLGKSYQIWRNDKGDGFKLEQSAQLPSGTQTVSFADMDRDGTIDMVFVTCSSVSSSSGVGSDCKINIAFNQQLPLCSRTAATTGGGGVKNGQRVCRPADDLCVADPNFKFDLSADSGSEAFISFAVSDLFPSTSLLVLDTQVTPAIPLPIRLGDSNLDGFPDLLFITASAPHGGFLGIGDKADRTPRLAFSVSCAKGVAGCGQDGHGRRGYKVVRKDAEVMNTIVDASGVAFFDIDEDGTLDIMIQRTGEQGQGPVLFVQNNFFYDAFFLKAIVLNGACDNGWCNSKNGSGRYHPFGVSFSGASYKYTVFDTTGQRSAAQVAQLPQTGYQSLLTPYAYFGLGRTNNYIENLFVGSTLKSQSSPSDHYIDMEGVIPNSKVVIYPPAGANGEGSWRRELYLRPGAWIPWVTLTVVVTAILLAIVVFVLHLNEKREDELERRRASHHINFDAL